MKELFSIGDAADFVGITRRIILNYEVHGLVFPDVKEDPSGNRYYTIDTLTKIRTIRSLQNLGLSLAFIHGSKTGIFAG
ncbi:MAG: MerR family transcriptional regulator [Roseburia sp.]